MASIRPCNKCGERISIRQMPHQQWVAFNVGTDDPHKCSKKAKKKEIKKIKATNNYKSINLSRKVNDNITQPEFIEDDFNKELEEIENLKKHNKAEDKQNGEGSQIPIGLVLAVVSLVILFAMASN